MMRTAFLDRTDLFSPLGRNFARFLGKLADNADPALLLAAALLSDHTAKGHVCLELPALAGRPLEEPDGAGEAVVTCPDLASWRTALAASPVVGAPGTFRPLILDDAGRLYLYRYWHYQQRLARQIHSRAGEFRHDVDPDLLRAGLARLFPAEEDAAAAVNWQQVAALAAVLRSFCVISGGPGTGKTSTVVKILALLAEQAHGSPMRIALAAPTGKAAARLREAIMLAREQLPCSAQIRAAIPEQVATLHRLLGSIPGSSRFRHDAENPLACDVVVVDEASMVDLPLMVKLMEAIPPSARLLLLGDRDQLASVESGAVLGDICDTGEEHPFSGEFAHFARELLGTELGEKASSGSRGLADSVVLLQRSYRFAAGSGIGRLSRAVQRGEGEAALGLLRGGDAGELAWRELPSVSALAKALGPVLLENYAPLLDAPHPAAALESLRRFMVLCPLRRGPYGVEGINALAENALLRAGRIRPAGRWYAGQPVMITGNDYRQGLFNGDIGVILADPQCAGRLRAYFPLPDGGVRRVLPQRLPEHETAFAMTVHKSQGSEFAQVLLLLPERAQAVLTRELIYTAVSRARQRVETWGRPEVFLQGVAQRNRRASGLRELLWAGDGRDGGGS